MIYETEITNTYALRGVALEANFVANAVQSIVDFFPSMMTSISKGFDRLKTTKEYVDSGEYNLFELSKKEQKIQELLGTVPYEDLTKLRLPTPEGFIGNYALYMDDLATTFDYHSKTCLPALEDFYELVASVVTNKNARNSLKDQDRVYKELGKKRIALNLKLAAPFVASSSQHEVEYKKLFTSNDDVSKAFKSRHMLVAELKKANVKEVLDLTEKINDALKTLIKLATEKDIEQLSAIQLKNITAGAYEIAAQIEFYAVNNYRSQVAVNSMSFAQDRLLGRLEK